MEQRTSLTEIIEHINPSELTYQEWCSVGMALKQEGYPVSVWDAWSQKDYGRYHTNECEKKWRTFSGSSSPVTGGTIVQLALDHGWVPEKLQAMSNLEKTKERKFTSGMNRRYRLIFSNPVSGMKKDDWVKIHPHFTPNFPANLQEEAEIAKNLEGVVSQETQLGVLSIVDNAQDEIKKINADQDKMRADLVMEQMFGGGGQDDE